MVTSPLQFALTGTENVAVLVVGLPPAAVVKVIVAGVGVCITHAACTVNVTAMFTVPTVTPVTESVAFNVTVPV
jgi:hypothetical protein